MKKDKFNYQNSFIINGFQAEGICRDNAFYVRFNDEEIEELSHYAFDMGYTLEPEITAADPEHPVRFKIISKANPGLFGWVSKIKEQVDGQWQDSFLYGFYRRGRYFNKYPVSFNIRSRMMRGVLYRNAVKHPQQKTYFRTIFGILDLEPEAKMLDFIFSWLWSVKVQHV